MKKAVKSNSLKGLLLAAVVFGLAGAMFILPLQFSTKAGGDTQTNENWRTVSHVPGLENYDIRTDKAAAETLAGFRASAGTDSFAVETKREGFIKGEETLRQRVPSLRIEYNEDIRIPEVIAPDVRLGRNFLTGSTSGKRAEVLRGFLKENNSLVGMTDQQLNELKVTADYTNPNGDLSFAHLEQLINGVPVFRGEVKAGFTRQGEMIRVINNLAPYMEYDGISKSFGDPVEAVKAAFTRVGREIKAEDTARNESASSDLRVKFGEGDWATTADKMYFPTEPGIMRAAWRVNIWEPVSAYMVIVDAETGALLWRKNATEDQTQTATYNVYANSTSMLRGLDNPAPQTPGPINPTLAEQFPLAARTNVTLIGNEAPNAFNNNGWITDTAAGVNAITDGNAVEAGIDRDGVNGVDPAGRAVATGRTFSFTYNPSIATTAGVESGDNPLTPEFQSGAVTQLFYLNNRYHDEMYKLGFTEQALNFQADNYGRGGVAGDRVSAEAQDSSGTNNANFATLADGNRGRMQMYIFTGPTPDRDGDLDAEIVIHEFTHGLSNRLHGNSSGLSNNMSRGMGEGWSDFYAAFLLAEPTDPIIGIYTTGGYATYKFGSPTYLSNYYHGIRRFPYAVRAFTGGANNRPHNPSTFADIDPAQFNLTDGAYPCSTLIGCTGSASQVHNAGEVWASAAFEVRARLMTRLGAAVGNRKTLQLYTDGMKLAPLGPSFLQERDAVLAAAAASSAAPEAALDVADVWFGFAQRGMGLNASVVNIANSTVIENFDVPSVLLANTGFAISDASGNNNGFPDPGENLTITVPLTNLSGATATGVTVQLVGGGSASYGDMAAGAVATRNITYTVPANTACGAEVTLTFNITSSATPASFTRRFTTGQPQISFTQYFDTTTVPALPTGWVATQTGGNTGWVTSATSVTSAPNAAFVPDPATTGEGTVDVPAFGITSSAAKLKFRLNHATEANWDGIVLEMKIGAGAFQDILAAGGTFVTGAYTGPLNTGSANPLTGRAAWHGNSSGYKDVEINLPAAANGQTVQFKFRMGSDASVAGAGSYIDNVDVIGGFLCAPTSVRSRADFDGDGRTDVSVFRSGVWHEGRSTAGYTAVQWGTATDTPLGGDFDADGKADLAVYRPSAAASTPDFLVFNSATSTVYAPDWGTTGDVPVVGDYTGDGRADAAVWRSSNNTFYVLPTGGGAPIIRTTQAGTPVVMDWDGDNKADFTNYVNGVWTINQSSGAATRFIVWGSTGDILVPADYDNDNKDDVAVFRPSNGTWYIYTSANTVITRVWGSTGDVPVPGDYNGDGSDDIAVFRNGTWYANTATGVQIAIFGVTGDMPIPRRYLP